VVEGINSSISEINNMTEQTANGVKQMAEANSELSNLAANLNTLVTEFKV